ncbi:Uma2 family endonuclease [Nocardia sp. CT2-14]|uniref:Uma2 family endonuclease n=2 Tax=Nocardia aurantiaca TaxID=2675850 RepID=A0A6I3KTT9_9NOCA|nr:Uma2 family endonuclease [Nocardia aurantiaca]
MTWEKLEELPDEIAGEIELWEGRVVWMRRGPADRQDCSVEFRNALRRCAREEMSRRPEHCWRVSVECDVFFGATGKSDFVTPDFLVYRCLEQRHQDIRAANVLIAGEVISPSNTPHVIEAKKARYASAGIPWYWEVSLVQDPGGIESVRAYALELSHGQLPPGVAPLHPSNYILVCEWEPNTSTGIISDHPFPIRIPWAELEF